MALVFRKGRRQRGEGAGRWICHQIDWTRRGRIEPTNRQYRTSQGTKMDTGRLKLTEWTNFLGMAFLAEKSYRRYHWT
jgi:hypothetical protein